jgi:hypothetical protein
VHLRRDGARLARAGSGTHALMVITYTTLEPNHAFS